MTDGASGTAAPSCAVCGEAPAAGRVGPRRTPVCRPCGARAFVGAIGAWAGREWERYDEAHPEAAAADRAAGGLRGANAPRTERDRGKGIS